MAAGTVSSTADSAMNAAVFRCPEPWVTRLSQSGFTMDFTSPCSVLVFLDSNQSSTLTRIKGAQRPVRMNAASTPSAASMPKDRKAAMSLNRFAANADMVVSEVSVMARPTLETVMLPASAEDFPLARSSL